LVKVKVYVEGGSPQNKSLNSECRKGFRQFFDKAGKKGLAIRVIPCGPRSQVLKDFNKSVANQGTSELPLLLIDSEVAINETCPMDFLKRKEPWWTPPHGSTADQVHLMVECMENWF